MIFWDLIGRCVPSAVMEVSGEKPLAEKLQPEMAVAMRWVKHLFGSREYLFNNDLVCAAAWDWFEFNIENSERCLMVLEGSVGSFDNMGDGVVSKEYLQAMYGEIATINFVADGDAEFVFPSDYEQGMKYRLLQQLMGLVVLRAFYNTFDALNVVLTPNGFGVVSNQQVAPASVERTKAYKNSLATSVNSKLSVVYSFLLFDDYWKAHQWVNFGKTLSSPGLILKSQEWYENINAWTTFSPAIIDCEREWAEKCVSPQLYEYLLNNQFVNGNRAIIVMFTNRIQNCLLNINMNKYEKMAEIVNLIRNTPSLFAIWKDTDTAALWSHKGFENKKNAGGYFF